MTPNAVAAAPPLSPSSSSSAGAASVRERGRYEGNLEHNTAQSRNHAVWEHVSQVHQARMAQRGAGLSALVAHLEQPSWAAGPSAEGRPLPPAALACSHPVEQAD